MFRFGYTRALSNKPEDVAMAKHYLLKHCKRDPHKCCVNVQSEQRLSSQSEEHAGMRVARDAYMLIREAWPYRMFERLMYQNHLNGVAVGE